METKWWEERREPVQIDLNIPAPADAPKPKRVRKGCLLGFGAVILRILGVAVGVGCIAYGAWIFYQITDNISTTGIIGIVAQGGFLCVAGILTLIAELRTRWVMRGCINTYIVFANYLTRGAFYLFLGALIFGVRARPPSGVHESTPPYVNLVYLAAGIIGVGALNIVYYLPYWKYERRKATAEQEAVPRLANPEEVVYGMDTDYMRKNTTAPQPAMDKVAPTAAQGPVYATQGPVYATQPGSAQPAPAELRQSAGLMKRSAGVGAVEMPTGKGKEPAELRQSANLTKRSTGIAAY